MDPLDGSFLNEVFYRCRLELQHPGQRDQEIPTEDRAIPVTLSSHMIAYYPNSFSVKIL